MSWQRKSNGDIIVSSDNEITPQNNIAFQMGTRELPDGSFLLLDDSLLYLCGEEKKTRRFFGRKSSEEVTFRMPFVNAIRTVRKDKDSLLDSCPHEKIKCRFYNEVFNVCSIAGRFDDMKKNKTPCSKYIVIEEQK